MKPSVILYYRPQYDQKADLKPVDALIDLPTNLQLWDDVKAHFPQLGKMPEFVTLTLGNPELLCTGHVASEADPKVCANCGTHIDSLRPAEDDKIA